MWTLINQMIDKLIKKDTNFLLIKKFVSIFFYQWINEYIFAQI